MKIFLVYPIEQHAAANTLQSVMPGKRDRSMEATCQVTIERYDDLFRKYLASRCRSIR